MELWTDTHGRTWIDGGHRVKEMYHTNFGITFVVLERTGFWRWVLGQ